jgi:transposase
MSIFLAEVARRHSDELILMLLDGAGWHRAKDLVVPDNIRLVPLPPYSPELNPIEHLWDELSEKWFGNCVFDSLNAVEDRLVEALANDRQRLKSMTAFPWIVNIPMNAT